MTIEKERLHRKLTEVGNDQEFKMYLLGKIDAVEENNAKLDKNFNVFKVKVYVFIAALVGAKEALIKTLFS